MDRRDDGRVDQAAVGQREEVEAVVDDVEVVGALEDASAMCRHSATFGSIAVVLGPAVRRTCCAALPAVTESAVANSVTSCPAATSPSVSSEANSSHGSVVARRGAPGDGREHGDPQG